MNIASYFKENRQKADEFRKYLEDRINVIIEPSLLNVVTYKCPDSINKQAEDLQNVNKLTQELIQNDIIPVMNTPEIVKLDEVIPEAEEDIRLKMTYKKGFQKDTISASILEIIPIELGRSSPPTNDEVKIVFQNLAGLLPDVGERRKAFTEFMECLARDKPNDTYYRREMVKCIAGKLIIPLIQKNWATGVIRYYK